MKGKQKIMTKTKKMKEELKMKGHIVMGHCNEEELDDLSKT